MIAILGTGLLGSGFVRGARRRGEDVTVWNRTLEKAKPLAAQGARVCPTAREAVEGASRIHLVLSDDAAVDAVMAVARLSPGATVYDHTTTSAQGARERTASWAARGVTYLHAPVFMGPSNAADATGVMLVSGDREVVARARPALSAMTGKLVDLGPRVDAAAAFKLLGNLFIMTLTAGLSDMLGLGRALGVPPDEVATLFDHFNPGTSVPMRMARVLAKAYDEPSWELAMARKDARLMEAEVQAAGIELSVLPGIAQRMDALLAKGLGAADWTIIARDHLR